MELAAPSGNMPRPPGGDGTAVARDDRVVAEATAQLVRHDLRLHRFITARAALLHQFPPLVHALLRGLEEGAVVFAFKEGQQRPERAPAVTDEADFDGIAQADPHWIELDLHTSGLPRLRQELDIRKGAADDQQRVTFLQRLLRRPRAEQADRSGGERAV